MSPQFIDGLRSQVHVDVKATNSPLFSWRPEKATDQDNGEEIFRSSDKKTQKDKEYVRIDSSPRKLYEARPETVKAMKYAQFACQYRKLVKSDHGYSNLLEQCSSSNQLVGPDSDFQIAGVPGRAAPKSMMLSNNVIMKIRENKIAVPILPNGEMDSVTENLLFGEWQYSEEVTDNDVDQDTTLKKEQKRSARLQLFPQMFHK